jgi:oxygen-independent coproporphyrinogen-3 oxidase
MGTVNEYTYVNVAELKRYSELTRQGLPPVNAGQRTPLEEQTRATMTMGLRMLSVSKETFIARHGIDVEQAFPELLPRLVERGLVVCDEHAVRLTELGTMFGYDVAKEFYSDIIRAHGQRLAESLARKRDLTSPQSAMEERPAQ